MLGMNWNFERKVVGPEDIVWRWSCGARIASAHCKPWCKKWKVAHVREVWARKT